MFNLPLRFNILNDPIHFMTVHQYSSFYFAQKEGKVYFKGLSFLVMTCTVFRVLCLILLTVPILGNTQ